MSGAGIEALLIVLFAAAVGLFWNRTLLVKAWHGETVAQAAPQAEAIPMPLGLAQVKELVDAKEAVVVDARDPSSYSAGHLKGAFSIPMEKARRDGAKAFGILPKGSAIITYCNGFSCQDSMELGKLLMKSGYPTVYVYEGGFPEWRDAGYPVETGGRTG